jgi:hypothetical protein
MKAQSDVISAVLIVIISLALASSAYTWGIPLIQKRQDTALSERVDTYFNQENVNSLPNVIESIANNGGEKNFYINAKGMWVLNQNDDYIQFSFMTKASKFAIDTQYPISLTAGVGCTEPVSNGTLGLDKASIVCVQANRMDDYVNVTYKVFFRELYDNSLAKNPKGYKITLVQDPSGLASSASETIKISFSTTTTETTDKTLIKKEIKILLI